MANAYSIRADYGEVVNPINLDLVNTVLQAKQQKYDKNVLAIDTMLAEYGNIDLERDEDRVYLYNKLQNLTEQVNAAGKLDLSNSNVTRSIQSHVSQVLDPRVIKQMGVTQKIRNYQKSAEEAKEDGTYSDLNYSFGLDRAGYNNYITGETNDLGQLSYREFTDVGAELNEISLNLDKFIDVTKVTTPQGMYYVTKDNERLSKDKVKAIAEQQLSDKAKMQMEVNAWANYERGMPPEQLTTTFTQYRDSILKNVDGTIAELEVEIKNAANSNEKKVYEQQLKDFKDYKINTEKNLNSYISNNNTQGMALVLEKETVLNNFASTFAIDNTTVEYKDNSVALQQQRLQAQAAKDALRGRTTEDGGEAVTPVDIANELPEIELYNSTLKKAEKFDEGYKAGVNQLYQKQDEVTKRAADKYVEDNSDSGLDREDLLFNYFQDKATKNSETISIPEIENINAFKQTAESSYKRYNDVTEQAYQNVEEKSVPTIYKTAVDNESIKILDDNGRAVSAKAYLESKGISSIEELENKPEVKKRLLQQYYADTILSEGEIPTTFGGRFAGIAAMVTGYRPNKRPSDRLTKLFDGDEKAAEDYLRKAEAQGAYDTNKGWDRATNTLSIMTAGLANLINPDNSFTDDQSTKNLITPSKVETEASTLIREDAKGWRDRGVRINTGSDLHNSVANAVGDVNGVIKDVDGSEAFQFNKNTPFSMRMISPDVVEIQQVKTIRGENKVERAEVLLNNIPQDVRSEINFGVNEKLFSSQTFPNLESRVRYNDFSNVKRRLDLAENVLGSPELAASTTKQETVGKIFKYYPQVVGTTEQPTEVGAVVNNVVNDSNFYVKALKINGRVYPSVVYKNNSGEEVTLRTEDTPIPEDSLDNMYKVMKYAPQIFVNRVLDGMIEQKATGTYSEIYEKLREIYVGNR